MILELNNIYEMYEIKRALNKSLDNKNKLIKEMYEYQDKLVKANTSWDIVNGVGKVIAGFKLDARTEKELLDKINFEV